MKRFIDICQFILVLFGLMICGMFVTSLIGLVPLHGYASLWAVFAGQNVFAFILPALLTWKMCFHAAPLSAIEADRFPSLRMIAVTLLIYFIGMPALNQLIYWNQEMELPEMFADFEQWCREMEKTAEQLTEGLLSSTDLFPTAMNILIIGILTGIGEEFFFRGALQRMLIYCRINAHAAIWTSAVIFSAIHFQFFGFIPRLLLGAFFGYLYWWSGCIWVNSFAHALNNSLVIIATWCINKGIVSEAFDKIGVNEGNFPIAAIFSALFVGAVIYFLHRRGVLAGDRIKPAQVHIQNTENATESN